MRRLAVLCLLATIVTSSCQYVPAANVSSSGSSTPLSISTALPSAMPSSDEPTWSATATGSSSSLEPSRPADSLEGSDEFWKSVFSSPGDQVYAYDSMAEISRDSHLILTGRVTDLRGGEVIGPLQFVYVTVAIGEVLYGTPMTHTDGTVELRLYVTEGTELGAVQAMIPQHRHLFFLLNGGEAAEEYGRPPEEQDRWRYSYLPAGRGGVIRDIDGQARGLRLEDPAAFPAGVEGDAFEDVVQRVRDIAGGG